MFNLDQAITDWRRQMRAAGITSSDSLHELENHLREQVAGLEAAGASSELAFGVAIQRLGDVNLLRAEFAKVRRANPPALKIIAGWLIFRGVEPLISMTAVWLSSRGHFGMDRLAAAMLGVCGLQAVVGVGLLYRNNICRILTQVWASLLLLSIPLASLLVFVLQRHPAADAAKPPATDIFLGVTVPFNLTLTLWVINLAVLAWSLYILNRRTVRTLFHNSIAN